MDTLEYVGLGGGTMTAPRVWVGEDGAKAPSRWVFYIDEWNARSADRFVYFGDIFVPYAEREPTVDPRDLDTLATCKVVDW